MEFTAVYIQVPEGYIAFVEELPGRKYAKGDTLDEARENLREAVSLASFWRRIANWPRNRWRGQTVRANPSRWPPHEPIGHFAPRVGHDPVIDSVFSDRISRRATIP